MTKRKTITVTLPVGTTPIFDLAKSTAEDALGCELSDAQYASRSVAWAAKYAIHGKRGVYEAMMYLESTAEMDLPDDALAMIWAAIYQLQRCDQMPPNFDSIVKSGYEAMLRQSKARCGEGCGHE